MDCNSIIYDVVRDMDETGDRVDAVIARIQKYIDMTRPNKTIFIAFDGVAPLAKMNQQRSRRHKTMWLQEADDSPSSSSWSTCNITPGTPFMNDLSSRVRSAFVGKESEIGVKKVIVSTSEECGEGEHKLFQYIRSMPENAGKKDTVLLYGLDSDLIMLSLFHCHHFHEFYVFRETPEFIKSSIPCAPAEPCHMLDIPMLRRAIEREMGSKSNIYDYVLMCFLLGNDFLPHFPAINLRTHGLDVLLDAYGKMAGALTTSTRDVNWSQMKVFFGHLAKLEHELIMQEYETRKKWSNRTWSTATPQDRENVLQNVPVIYRAEELYIDPSQDFWQKRYYQALFTENVSLTRVCLDYIEGLDWTFRYYTKGCCNWRWKYEHAYAPLLGDLHRFFQVPGLQVDAPPFPAAVQLAYVLPQKVHSELIPRRHEIWLAEKYGHLYQRPSAPYLWAFCRYFWEAHVVLPEISDEVLEDWEREFE